MNEKLKIKVKTIVGRPIVQNIDGQASIVGYEFIQALKKLGTGSLPVKEKYAISKALRICDDMVKCYQDFYDAAIQRNGVKHSILLERRLLEIEEITKNTPIKTAGLDMLQVEKKKIAKHLETIRAHPEREPYGIDTQNVDSAKAFEKEIKAEQEYEFEIYLDHKIKIPADSTLDSHEMDALVDVAEYIPES